MMSLKWVNISGMFTLAGVLLAWEAAVASGAVHLAYLPPPTSVATALVEAVRDGQMLDQTAHTLLATLIAWAVAMLVGVSGGVVIALWWPARLMLTTSVEVLRSFPATAFVPIAVLVLGFSTTTEVIVAAWAAAFPVLINTLAGVESVHPRLGEVAAVLRLTAARRLKVIVLPAAAPVVIVGARLALATALIVTVVVEMIGNPAGLGFDIVQMQQAIRPDVMFADVLMVGLWGAVLNAALLTLARRVVPGARGRGDDDE